MQTTRDLVNCTAEDKAGHTQTVRRSTVPMGSQYPCALKREPGFSRLTEALKSRVSDGLGIGVGALNKTWAKASAEVFSSSAVGAVLRGT